MTDFPEQILFTRGNPAVEALPVHELSECAVHIFKEQGNVLFQYGHYSGFKPLRECIASSYGVDVSQVLIGNGSMEFFTFSASVLLEEKGDAVFLEYPSYDRAVTAMKRAGADVKGIPMMPDGVDIKAFERQLHKTVPKLFYTIPDFQNPSGITTSLEKRKHIASLSEKYGFYIVEDGPYRPLRYYGDDVPSYRELMPHRVIFISSFSKTLSPGMRVGYMIGPEKLMPTLHKWSEDTYIHPNLVVEGMVYEYCRRGLLEPNIATLKNLYRPRLDGLLRALGIHMIDGIQWIKPQGGFFVSLTLPESVNGTELQENSKQFGFLVAKGNGFFVDGKGDQFIRLPFCQMEPAEAEEGIKRLAAAIRHFHS